MADLPGPEELECGLNELGRSSGVDEVDETASLPPAAPFSVNTFTYNDGVTFIGEQTGFLFLHC